MRDPRPIAALAAASLALISCGGSLADAEGPADPAPGSSLASDPAPHPLSLDPVEDPLCASDGDPIEDLRVEVHDGDWGYASIMVMATLNRHVVSVSAKLITVSSGETNELPGTVTSQAATGCGQVAVVGWDLSKIFSVTQAHVTLVDITFDDGTVLPGPYELEVQTTWIGK